MKRFIIILFVLLIGLYVQQLFADPIFSQPGYTHTEYDTITSTGMHVITLDRKVNKIEIIGITTDTYHLFPWDQLTSSVTISGNGDNKNSQACDREYDAVALTTEEYYLVDGSINASTANTKLTFPVQTDLFTIYVPTTTIKKEHAVSMRVQSWGW
jgi:hypothetical protein